MQVAAIPGHKTRQMPKRYTRLRADDMVRGLPCPRKTAESLSALAYHIAYAVDRMDALAIAVMARASRYALMGRETGRPAYRSVKTLWISYGPEHSPATWDQEDGAHRGARHTLGHAA